MTKPFAGTWFPGHEERGPTRAAFALCDTIGGMTGAFAVASALYQRAQTGKGQAVDVAMLDAALSFLGPQVAEYPVTGYRHRQFGNLSSTRKPTGNRFAAGEGHLMLTVMTDAQFERLMRALGRTDALEDADSAIGRRASRTRRHCARSSSRRSPAPTPRPANHAQPPPICPPPV